MRLDLFSLQLVQNIIQTGNLTEAAKLSHISLQAASERLKKLEQHFQSNLFIRRHHGLEPTSAAKTLSQHSQLLLKQAEQLESAMQKFVQQPTTQLQLYCNSSVQSEYLPALLPQFLQQHPHFQIDLHEAESADIVSAVENNKAALGIISNFFGHQNLAAQPFAADPLVLICSRQHPLNTTQNIELAHVLSYPFVGLMVYQSLQQSIEAQAQHLLTPIHYRLRLPNFAAIAQVVSQNVGVAIIPKRAAQRLQSIYDFHCVALNGAWANRQLMLVAKDFNNLTKDYQLLSEFLLEQAQHF
jgi:molybdate transport repressor ModE-like protein